MAAAAGPAVVVAAPAFADIPPVIGGGPGELTPQCFDGGSAYDPGDIILDFDTRGNLVAIRECGTTGRWFTW